MSLNRDAIARRDKMMFLILSMLNNQVLSKFDMQSIAGKKNVSGDTIRDNLDKMDEMGIVCKMAKKKGKSFINGYIKMPGAFCAWGCLCTPSPLALFPCEYYFDCNYKGNPGETCMKMEWAIASIGIPRDHVNRVFEEEI